MKFSFPFGMIDRTCPIPAASAMFHKNKNNGRMQAACIEYGFGRICYSVGKRYMGKADIVSKDFFRDKERFADLINRHLYHGEKILVPENLIYKERNYPSLLNYGTEKCRDILLEDVSRSISFGLELETKCDYSMPERIITYDICEYEQQILELHREHLTKKEYKSYIEKKSRMKVEDLLHPTVTVVLYLGEGHWNGRRTLSDMFGITDRDRRMLGTNLLDYSIIVVEADFTNPEDYHTDLREFFQAMQCRRDRDKLGDLIHSEEFKNLKLETERAIAVYLHVSKLLHLMEKEDQPMCKAFDELMKEERRTGRREGKREGKKEEKISIIRRMIKEGCDEVLISRTTRCTKEEFMMAAGRSKLLQ